MCKVAAGHAFYQGTQQGMMGLRVTKEDLVRVSAVWGEMAFDALAYLEKTSAEIERAAKSGIEVPESLKAARESASTNLDAALYSAPALRDAIKGMK